MTAQQTIKEMSDAQLRALINSTPDIRNDPDFEVDNRPYEERVKAIANATSEKPLGTPETAKGTGWRWIVEMEPADPTPPLVGPFMATTGATIMYGPGGVGKTTTAAWLALEHTSENPNNCAYILDFEHHENQWTTLLHRLGIKDKHRIAYVSPFSQEWTGTRGTLIDIAPRIKADCDELGVTLLIVDSYTAATTPDAALGGQPGANDYFDALSIINTRSLTLAHVAGNSQRHPQKPFGTVFVHNWARETWSGERETFDEPTTENEHGQTYMKISWRNQKANEGPLARDQILLFTYVPNNGPISVQLEQLMRNNGTLVENALREAETGLSINEIQADIEEKTGERLTDRQIRDAIRWHKPANEIVREGSRPFRYRIL
jgi:hypothetical protein